MMKTTILAALLGSAAAFAPAPGMFIVAIDNSTLVAETDRNCSR